MNKEYKILFDYGAYEGCKFQDETFTTITAAVKHAMGLNYSSPFFIVKVIDWKIIEECPYPDCPEVHYYECPIHGQNK